MVGRSGDKLADDVNRVLPFSLNKGVIVRNGELNRPVLTGSIIKY